jgi:hypothetical protein
LFSKIAEANYDHNRRVDICIIALEKRNSIMSNALQPHPLTHPDSGNHPLPSDEREIEAVVRAGRRCYEAHPYFAQRYAARGEAFTRSDGGYLATLADHPQSHVEDQVNWLAGVLASRGIPRWLMECHLDMLYEELSAAVPDRVADYGKLQQAAGVLRAARQKWITQADFDALAARFEANAGNGCRNTGGLLIAAVCDECNGLSEAVPSLSVWLGDENRFSPQWCAAVAQTLAAARARVAPQKGASA